MEFCYEYDRNAHLPSMYLIFKYYNVLIFHIAVGTTCATCNPGARYGMKYWYGENNKIMLSGGYRYNYTIGITSSSPLY